MSDTNFTPGPWIKSGLPSQYPEAVNADGPVNICRVPVGEERDANAALIAASPDLYAACERILLALEADAEQGHRFALTTNGAAVNDLRSALRKARGEA